MKAPFPWFGGKSRVADVVWRAMGDVDNYIEPFAGSLATLLMRPDWHARRAETVNDADCYLANFWRAVSADPDAVAKWCDWPVNECDLLSRHVWLVNEGRKRIALMEADPEFFDAKVAGWWVWGINSWIGSGWCSGTGPWSVVDGEVAKGTAGRGVNRKLPHLGDAGQGVNRKLPNLPARECGGEFDRQVRDEGLLDYFQQLAARLRRVRVCCGDWARVVTEGAMSYGDSVGVLLDPPYLGDVRTKDLYSVDNHDIADAVRGWAIEHGSDRRLRIVLCGYEAEHGVKMPAGWTCHAYSATRAYGSAANPDSDNATNRHNERLWFSPGCLREEAMPLFR